MKTSKQKSTALGVKHVQGDMYYESRDSSGLKKGQQRGGKVKVCTQHAKNKSSKSFVVMRWRVQRQVCQSCNGSLSKCREDQATCPNVASPHINKL